MTECRPGDLGFIEAGPERWRRSVRGREVVFRRLTTLAELTPLEELQREVMGASDLDVFPANGLIVVPETGGAVLAAEVDGELAGALWGFGGLVDGRPRIVSDWMGVRAPFRALGLGAELKRLQAALALEGGFDEIVWTVDPLRAANARLNVAKLGATSRRYEVDRYGAYAAGLYGAMPTDRLHMEWDLRDRRVLLRLRTGASSVPASPPSETLARDCGTPEAMRRRIPIPDDIDALVHVDHAAAIGWRMRVREQFQAAFAEGFVLDGFEPGGQHAEPAHVLSPGDLRVWRVER